MRNVFRSLLRPGNNVGDLSTPLIQRFFERSDNLRRNFKKFFSRIEFASYFFANWKNGKLERIRWIIQSSFNKTHLLSILISFENESLYLKKYCNINRDDF